MRWQERRWATAGSGAASTATSLSPVAGSRSRLPHFGGVAQMCRALACQARGRRFKSGRPRSFYPHGVPAWRVVAIMVLSGVSLAAGASAAAPRLFTAAATDGCLTSLPDAIVGLPPATPPVPPKLFVYSFSPGRLLPRVHAKLGAWYGRKRDGSYEGLTLSFLKNAHDARVSFKPLVWPYAGKVSRNVVVAWDQSSVPRRSLQRRVLGCLRAEAGTPAPNRSTPRASLATFVGYWGGHTRGLRISSGGRGTESADSGCCVREYHMTFQVLSVSGTLTRATAAYRVTSFTRYDRHVRTVRVGQVGRLRLRNGIVTNTLTEDYFCSTPAWGATGVCGA